MRRTGLWLLVAAAAWTGPSCSGWVKSPEHTITILAVDRLNLNEEFTFTVNVKYPGGEPLKKVNYEYRIDWIGTKPYHGKGKTGILETIRVRGEKGSVTLHILGYDAQDNFGKVAKHTFEVQ